MPQFLRQKNKKDTAVDHVVEFYRSYNNKDRNMTTLEHGKRGIPLFLRITGVLIIALCATAAWVGYQYYSNGQIPFFSFTKNGAYIDTRVSLEKAEIMSNGLFNIRVFLKNTSAQPLDPVSVIIDYPDGYAFYQAMPVAPKNEKKNYWEIGSLASGEEITLIITGRVSGSPDPQEKNIHTTVFYKPVSLSSEFKTEVDTSVVVNPPQFRLRIDGPTEVEKGSDGAYTIAFHKPFSSTPEQDAFANSKLEVVFEPPKGFNLKEINPAPAKQGFRWDFAGLATAGPGDDTVSISARGFFQGENNFEPLAAKIGYYLGEEFVLIDQAQFLPSFAVPFEKNLLLSITVDGQKPPIFLTPTEPYIQKGIPLAISYENAGKITLENVSFTMRIPKNNILLGVPDDWGVAKSDPVFPYTYNEGDDSEIRITPAELPMLAEIGPSATGTISLFFRNTDYQSFRTLVSQGAIDENPLTVALVADIGGPKQRSLQAPQIVIKRASDISLRVNASAGNTISAIEWIIENTFHELENIRVSMILPESLAWTENTSISAGTIRYTPDTREALWTVNRLPKGVKSISARFDLEGARAQGEKPVITTLTAKDKVTGSIISIQKPID